MFLEVERKRLDEEGVVLAWFKGAESQKIGVVDFEFLESVFGGGGVDWRWGRNAVVNNRNLVGGDFVSCD